MRVCTHVPCSDDILTVLRHLGNLRTSYAYMTYLPSVECRKLHCPDVMKIAQFCQCSDLIWPKLPLAGGRKVEELCLLSGWPPCTTYPAWGSLV